MRAPVPIFPPLLSRGDTIGIAAPASPPLKPGVIEESIARLTAYGFKIKAGRFLRRRDRYLAGSDAERAADINDLFADREVRAIFCLRGGYGSCRILPLLNYETIRANPKPLLGYSDITALHLAIWAKTGLVTFHGPNASSAFEPSNLSVCEAMLLENGGEENRDERALFSGGRVKTLVPGRASGRLLGGNFTSLLRLIGTPYQPDLRGAILFLEDTNERAYRIDGMFAHLRLAGVLDQIGGLVLGQFDFQNEEREQRRIGVELALEAKALNIPCVTRAPIGHFAAQIILPQGVLAHLDAGARTLTFRRP